MTPDIPPPPADAAEARALVDALVPPAADLPAPTAADVRDIMRSQNWKVFWISLALLAVGGASVWYSATGRTVSQDSADATRSALENNARSACITERRNAELDAVGDVVAALGRAQIAGFFDDDSDAVATHRAAFEEADARRVAAAESLQPDVLNQDRPIGCGPPILSSEDIPSDDPDDK